MIFTALSFLILIRGLFLCEEVMSVRRYGGLGHMERHIFIILKSLRKHTTMAKRDTCPLRATKIYSETATGGVL